MGKQWKQWETSFCGAPKSLQMVTAAMKCSLEENYDQPRQHIKKQRHYFANKVHLVKAMVFPVVIYGCESWTIKKAEHQKNWHFLTVVLEKPLKSPLDWKEIQSVILKQISPEYSFEGLMLKLKRQYFGHLMRRTDSFEKTLMWDRFKAGGERDDRRWDGWMASPTQRTCVWVSSRSWWWTGRPGILQSMRSQGVRHNWVTELNWRILIHIPIDQSRTWVN